MTSTPSEPDRQAAPAADVESRMDRAGRYTRHGRMYAGATVLAVALVLLVVLIAENTRTVKVGWVFGYSHTSLIYLVVFATLLGWLLGIATSMVFRHRTKRPR